MSARAPAVALDTTYAVGTNLSGVGVYSREISEGLAEAHPGSRFFFCYRPHRFLRSFSLTLPKNARRKLLWRGAPAAADLFHALNQRVDVRHKRTVSTFHDLFVLTAEYSTPGFRERFARQAREAAERSDLIITVSEFTAQQVEDLLKVNRSRIRVVPHGTRAPAPAVPCSREPIVLFVGALQRRKNVARLVRAFEHMPAGWTLVLAGSMGFGSEETMKAIADSPRRSDIKVVGYVPGDELESLYRRASIFAFPSLDEGFGMPVLEAMARGVPVLTSNRSALPEVAGGAALLVDPTDTGAIAMHLGQLADDQALREDLSRRGRERASAYTWRSTVEKTAGVYRELLR